MPQMPWGNAFIIGTPKSDRLVQQIGQDQRQRELYEQRQAQLLDQEFAKNASAIRDIDISDAVKRYQQYKNIGQDLYKNGNRMTNEQRIAKQLEKQRAASDYYSLVNKSKELKEPEDLVQKNYFKNPDKMEETTPDYLMLSRRTPALQHPGVNDIMRNTELQTKDFSKIVAGAMGGANGRPVKVANEVKDNGLTSTPIDYYALNSPSQFASKVMEGIQTKSDKNKFVQQHSYSDLAAEDILRKYAIEKEKPAFKKVYPNEPDYTSEDLSDPFMKAVTLLAMEHIIRNPPTAMEGRPFNNTEDVMLANQKYRTVERLAHEGFVSSENKKKEAGKNARVAAMMSDENVEYPLNVLVENYGQEHQIKSSEGLPLGTIKKVKESDIPVGELNLFNKKKIVRGFESGREVNPIIDPDTKEPYYNAVQNADGNWELIGEEGKKLGADDTREKKINVTVPANKEKRKLFFDKKITKPKKDPLGLF